MNPARRTDWKTLEMPAETAHLEIDRVFTNDDFARLCFGVVPGSMEDKWFVFYERPWLNLHRSWTGECIYRVRFERRGGGVAIVETVVSRAGDPRAVPDPAGDARRLLDLFESIVRRNFRYGNVRLFPVLPVPPE
jgi:8-oxo-dGTP diphosphatase